jgi:hypothetical protein
MRDALQHAYGFPGQDIGVPGCTTTLYSGATSAGWVQYTMSHPNADISFVVIGGAANDRPIAQVQFNSPVSLQLDGLIKEVTLLAPREGLAIKLLRPWRTDSRGGVSGIVAQPD